MVFSTSGVNSKAPQKWIQVDQIHFQVAELEKRWTTKNWPQQFSKFLKVPKVDFFHFDPKLFLKISLNKKDVNNVVSF